MRKTLLIAASALAASIISSQAGVYSQNIVGYVNEPVLVGHYVNCANPLDASNGNNEVTNVIPVFSTAYDGDLLIFWNGSTFVTYTIDSTWSSGIGNASDTAAVTTPIYLPPGTGFLLQNTAGTVTNTYVGTVHVDAAATGSQTVGSTTNTYTVTGGYVFTASKLPLGGPLSTAQFPTNGTFDGSLVSIPNITGGGAFAGYITVTVDSGMGPGPGGNGYTQYGGWGNSSDTGPANEPVVPVATGFFFQNTTGTGSWVQSL